MRLKKVAQEIGVSESTIKRWIREGRIKDPRRDNLGWRIFSEEDVEKLKSLFNKLHPGVQRNGARNEHF